MSRNCLENMVTSGNYFDLDIAKFLLKYIFKDSKYENKEVIKYLLEDFVVLHLFSFKTPNYL